MWRFFPSPEEGSGLSAAIDLVSPVPTADLMVDRPLCVFFAVGVSVLSGFSDLDSPQPAVSQLPSTGLKKKKMAAGRWRFRGI